MTFKPHEVEFMRARPLGRLATTSPRHVQNIPVAFQLQEDLGTIDILGFRMSKTEVTEHREQPDVASSSTTVLYDRGGCAARSAVPQSRSSCPRRNRTQRRH